MRLKNAPLHRRALPFQQCAESVVERLCLLRPRRPRKTRPPPLARIAVQRELAHRQRRAAYIRQPKVHLAGAVLKQPQPCNLSRQPRRLRLAIPFPYPQQHQEPSPNPGNLFAAHLHARPVDPLH